ncbi:DUF4861 family protein [Cellulophaga sp. E16_2]|uniref:DUF4861 family protein n=1 Tax=Cellulophaga sp. E16_2 TaxID=2789297 RepID=UPI0021024A91|nr:DUF4861 family protein [Cellulophaga sp. E16_2]
MMNVNKLVIFLSIGLALQSCEPEKSTSIFVVKNELNVERSFETVELSKEFLADKDLNTIGVKDVETGKLQVIQLVDTNGDAVVDQLLFQPKVGPNAERKFEIVTATKEEQPTAPDYCYSRFVPERTDDYTWENDRVAFRMYGPTAQQMIEDSIPGGTLSSGVDAWLKKVEYPIINKWYEKNSKRAGAYHEDTGEGLDNFHVGSSRGVGGLAIKEDTTYYYSENFTEWKTITTGPIRTSFYLKHKDWKAGEHQIQESKIISLDLGSNFSKFEISLEGSTEIAVGLTLHEKDGVVTGDVNKGWVSYWEPHADSELGSGIIASKKYFIDYETYDTNITDLSNAYANLKVINDKVVYYAGFGWKESGQFKTKEAWEKHLNNVSEKINNPLIVRKE